MIDFDEKEISKVRSLFLSQQPRNMYHDWKYYRFHLVRIQVQLIDTIIQLKVSGRNITKETYSSQFTSVLSGLQLGLVGKKNIEKYQLSVILEVARQKHTRLCKTRKSQLIQPVLCQREDHYRQVFTILNFEHSRKDIPYSSRFTGSLDPKQKGYLFLKLK